MRPEVTHSAVSDFLICQKVLLVMSNSTITAETGFGIGSDFIRKVHVRRKFAQFVMDNYEVRFFRD